MGTRRNLINNIGDSNMAYIEKQNDKVIFQAHIRDIWELFKRLHDRYTKREIPVNFKIEIEL